MDHNSVTKKILQLPVDKLPQVDALVDSMNMQESQKSEFKLTNYSESIDRSKDLLGRYTLAENLANIIDSDIDPPFTIGVYGKWGSGKSIFLSLLQNCLEQSTLNKPLVVYFNAWKFESTGNIMFSLYRSLEELLSKDSKKKRDNSRFGRSILKGLSALIREHAKLDIPKLFQFSKSKKSFEIFDDNYESVKAVEKGFSSTVQEILLDKKKKLLVIMVDDLDRCMPENVVSMLESIKNFLSTANCVFILSADKEVVAAGIQSKYANSNSVSGEDYLEKIVNLSIELSLNPSIGISNLLSKYQQDFANIIGGHNLSLITIAFDLLRNQNFRLAKRILDKYIVYVKIPATLSNFHQSIILFTLLLQEMLPELYSDIKKFRNREIIDQIVQRSTPSKVDNTTFPPFEAAIIKHSIRQEIRDFTLRFKDQYISNPQDKNRPITKDLTRCIQYLENFTILPP